MFRIIFPPKCVLCRKLLSSQQTDLCHECRSKAPAFTRAKRNIPFIAHWPALWYYKDDVAKSIRRFKFGNLRSYAESYARMLVAKLPEDYIEHCDILTWVPVSFLRKLRRGYDQSALLAKALGHEISIEPIAVLKKIRHTPPQSGMGSAAKRRANVLGAYKVRSHADIAGKRILLLDDVVTTGATASECARTLLTAGAKEVYFAAVAAALEHK